MKTMIISVKAFSDKLAERGKTKVDDMMCLPKLTYFIIALYNQIYII